VERHVRILIVHNYYGRSVPSGENNVVDAEIALLRRFGHDVDTFIRYSDSIRDQGLAGEIRGALAVVWNPFAVADLVRQVRLFKPAVVHVHNTFPLISAAIFKALRPYAARVLTLHNYRMFCAQGLFSRAGTACMDCYTRKTVLPALKHGCYRGTMVATLPLAAATTVHRALGTWRREVDAYIALTEYQRRLFVNGGLPPARVHVRGNFFARNPPLVAWHDRRPRVTYVGRISEQKGVAVLVRAWLQWGRLAPVLQIVGEGPLLGPLQAEVVAAGAENIEFVGVLAPEQVFELIARTWLAIVPSLGVEGFPMVIQEAFACGTPVAVSDSQPLPAIVQSLVNGIVFRAGDPDSLASAVRRVWASPESLQAMGSSAYATYQALYTPDASHAQLSDVYRHAIAEHAAS
jgi:glycosyltransferase involved in cell wall biosynthesis